MGLVERNILLPMLLCVGAAEFSFMKGKFEEPVQVLLW
jgi:hypothetical protein